VLLNILHFPSIYILLDGLDATGEIVDDPSLAVDFFAPLISNLLEWNKQCIYLKSFIPIETKASLELHSSDLIINPKLH